MITFILSTFIALFLLVWFKSDALIEWGSLFGLENFLLVKEYNKMKLDQAPISINYPTFLKMKYNNFITKLLACPLCLTFWLSTISAFFLFVFVPLIIFMIPTIIITSLVLYGIVTSLLKLS